MSVKAYFMAEVKEEVKYKVGDLLEIVSNAGEWHYFNVGQIVEVIELPEDKPNIVRTEGYHSKTKAKIKQSLKEEHFKKAEFKVGDKVKLVSKRPKNWNGSGFMDDYLGREVVINQIYDYNKEIGVPDKTEGPLMMFRFDGDGGWRFRLSDIDEKIDQSREVLKAMVEKSVQPEVVAPQKYQIKAGDKVKISRHSDYYGIDAVFNPKDQVGEVIYLRENTDHIYRVKWKKGENSYRPEDLVVVKRS